MTQEEKDLLLKDLCARLPYEPWVWFRENWETNPNFKGNQSLLRLYHLEYIVNNRDITLKPYLRPMSSMTKEEFEEYEKANDIDTADSHKALKAGLKGEKYISAWYRGVDWLNSHHFDYRRLIEKGLALEAPKYMYKTKE